MLKLEHKWMLLNTSKRSMMMVSPKINIQKLADKQYVKLLLSRQSTVMVWVIEDESVVTNTIIFAFLRFISIGRWLKMNLLWLTQFLQRLIFWGLFPLENVGSECISGSECFVWYFYWWSVVWISGSVCETFFFDAADGDGYSVVFSSQFGCKAVMCVRLWLYTTLNRAEEKLVAIVFVLCWISWRGSEMCS